MHLEVRKLFNNTVKSCRSLNCLILTLSWTYSLTFTFKIFKKWQKRKVYVSLCELKDV
jgi:hypothetical protein